MIERIHLEILEGLAACGTLTHAAKQLHVTQSALSHAINKLEVRLGVELKRKVGRKIVLTGAGEQLLQTAQQVLPRLRRVEEALRHDGAGLGSTLRIGMECHPCRQWFERMVPRFLHACPDVDLDVRQRFQFGAIGALYAHDVDLVVTPDPYFRRGLHFEPVFRYQLVAVVGAGHRLAQKKDRTLHPGDLSEEVLLTYPVPKERLDIFTRFLLPAKQEPRFHKTLETTELMLHMVAAGRGVAVMPDWLLHGYAEEYVDHPLHVLQVGQSGLAKTQFIGVRRQDLQLASIKSFLDIAKQV